MEAQMKKTRERLEEEFAQISSMEKWTKESLETMKNILKAMYYIDVICAMKDGDESFPGSEYMGHSYARGGQRRNSMGQYSRTGYYDGGMSGRRYYDDERTNAVHRLQQMINTEDNEELRMALMNAVRELNG